VDSEEQNPIDDTATAYHEAGHAVVAMLLGRPVEKVTIERNSLRLGQVQMSQRRGTKPKDSLEVHALILFAGVIAEFKHTQKYNWGGAEQDMIGIRQLARSRGATDKQVERIQQRWFDKVHHMLDDTITWKAIDRIAIELLDKKCLSGRAVKHWIDYVSHSDRDEER